MLFNVCSNQIDIQFVGISSPMLEFKYVQWLYVLFSFFSFSVRQNCYGYWFALFLSTLPPLTASAPWPVLRTNTTYWWITELLRNIAAGINSWCTNRFSALFFLAYTYTASTRSRPPERTTNTRVSKMETTQPILNEKSFRFDVRARPS